MTQHPRASELGKLIAAAEKAGKPVSSVEVSWRNIEGREVPVWVLRFGGEGERAEEKVEW